MIKNVFLYITRLMAFCMKQPKKLIKDFDEKSFISFSAVLTLGILAYILAFIVNVFDPDLWARLAVGSIFFQTGGVLKHDIFAYTLTKDVWVDHEWGSSVIFYFLAKHFGQWGILHLKAILIFSIFILLVQTIRLNKNKSFNIEPLYFIIAAVSIFPSVASPIRCQLFTFLFFALWIYVLERVRRGENKFLWILPATMVLWANMHGGFVVGLGLLLIYGVGEFLNKNNYFKYLIVLILSVLVTLINPYGFKYWQYIAEAATMARPGINEWGPISLSDPSFMFLGVSIHIFAGFVLFVLFTMVVGLRHLIKKHKPDWVKILLFVILIYLGFSHKRHAIFLILSASALLYFDHVSIFKFLGEFISNKFGERVLKFSILSKGLITIAAVLWAGVILFNMPKELIVSPNHYPVGSVEFIKQNNLSGNVLTSYRWGNYVLWKLYPQCLVAVDGRYEEVYPNEVFDSVMIFTHRLNDEWQNVINKYKNTDIIIVSRQLYTYEDLSVLKNWEIVYVDAVSFLLLPKNKLKKTYIMPDFANKIYWHADLSKSVNL